MKFVYRIFLKGLLTLIPIILTIYLLTWIVTRTESALRDLIIRWLPDSFVGFLDFPGFGLIFALTLVFVVGLLVNSYLTNRFVAWFERALESTPVIRTIYSPLRDVTKLFVRHDENASQRVVMVQLDSNIALGEGSIEAIGLVTRETFTDLPPGTIADGYVAVFVPFSYGVGGFTLIVPKDRVRETQLPADRAMQLALTGWIKAAPK